MFIFTHIIHDKGLQASFIAYNDFRASKAR